MEYYRLNFQSATAHEALLAVLVWISASVWGWVWLFSLAEGHYTLQNRLRGRKVHLQWAVLQGMIFSKELKLVDFDFLSRFLPGNLFSNLTRRPSSALKVNWLVKQTKVPSLKTSWYPMANADMKQENRRDYPCSLTLASRTIHISSSSVLSSTC